MGPAETELQKAERRVHESQERVAHQRQLVLKLEAGGFPAVEARELLSSYEQALRHHEMQLELLWREHKNAPQKLSPAAQRKP